MFSLLGAGAYFSLFRLAPGQIFVIIDKTGRVSEAPLGKNVYFYPGAIIPGQAEFLRIPLLEKNFEVNIEEKPPIIYLAGLPDEYKVRIQILGSFIPIPGKMKELYNFFNADLKNLEQSLVGRLRHYMGRYIGKLFRNQKQMEKLGKFGLEVLEPELKKFKAEMLRAGLELKKIQFGIKTNISDFSKFLVNVYNTKDIKRLINQITLDKYRLENEKNQKKAQVKLENDIKDLKQKRYIKRLEEMARVIKRNPDAYKVMFLDKLDKNVKVMVLPGSNNFSNLQPLLREEPNDKGGDNTTPSSTLGPGEFLEQ